MVSTTSRSNDPIKPETSRAREPRRVTGIPTNVLPAQHRIRADGTLATTHTFELPVQPGDVINGKYRVGELIGVGGVGFVVAATHLQLDDSVALKLLKPELASDPDAVQMFSLEARASFRLKSEHVVRTYDVDKLPSGVPFMVMELLRGEDLRRALKRYRYLPIELSVDIALQICEALATAHACQVVHRDIKPENLFVEQAGDIVRVKVLDFGISQALSPSAITSSTMAIGTPPYMSPEQIRGARDLDARADQWSLGCVLYELLTGYAPFARLSVMQACAAVLEEEPVPLAVGRPDVPPALDQIVMRCLSKDRSQRFADVADLATALAPFGKNALFCAPLCAIRLASPARSSAPPPAPLSRPRPTMHSVDMRLPTQTRQAVGRAPTHSNVRRQTLHPLSTPAPLDARSATAIGPRRTRAHGYTAASVPPPAPQAIDEASDLMSVPGLRPARVRWLVLAACAVALGLAYLALHAM
jgi:serine/threonine protein kinase